MQTSFFLCFCLWVEFYRYLESVFSLLLLGWDWVGGMGE